MNRTRSRFIVTTPKNICFYTGKMANCYWMGSLHGLYNLPLHDISSCQSRTLGISLSYLLGMRCAEHCLQSLLGVYFNNLRLASRRQLIHNTTKHFQTCYKINDSTVSYKTVDSNFIIGKYPKCYNKYIIQNKIERLWCINTNQTK